MFYNFNVDAKRVCRLCGIPVSRDSLKADRCLECGFTPERARGIDRLERINAKKHPGQFHSRMVLNPEDAMFED